MKSHFNSESEKPLLKKAGSFLTYDIICVLIFAAYMTALILGIRPENTIVPFSSKTLTDLSGGWSADSGEEISLRALGGLISEKGQTIILKRTLPDSIPENTDLCFRSKNIYFSVALDGQTVYDFHPSIGIIGSRSYGSTFHQISIPSGMAGKTITITAQPIYDDNNCFFDMMKIGNSGAYYQWFMQTHFLAFVLCLIIVIFGFVTLILSFTLGRSELTAYNLRSLAFFSMGVGSWTLLEESLIPQMMTGQLSFIHGFNYMLLIFMGYPAVQFVNSLMTRPNKVFTRIALAVTLCDFTACALLNGLGILDFHECLPLIHACLFADVIMIIWMFISNEITCRKNHIPNSNVLVFAAFFVFAVFGVMDLFRYRLSSTGVDDAGYFLRIGLLLFFLLLFVRSSMLLFRKLRLASEAAAIRQIAYTDTLTGIGNRAAFVEKEAELEKAVTDGSLKSVMVCQFDANDLKSVNDRFGHAIGDSFIRAVSDAILNSFGKEGFCYRIGGDEFTVFLTKENLQESFLRCSREMAEAVDRFNHSPDAREKLYIACGCALYEKKEGLTLEDAEREADRKMYEDKARSKKS